MFRFLVYFFIAFIIYMPTLAQKNQKDISDVQRQLQQIRSEIATLQKKLQESETILNSQLDDMKNLDLQTTFGQKALRILKVEIRNSQSQIILLNSQINRVNISIKKLQEKFKKQILFMYKYQKGREFEWLLGSQNFNQALLRYHYFQKIAGNVKRIFKRLNDRQNELKILTEERHKKLDKQFKYVSEKETEQQALTGKREKRHELIKKIYQNKSLLESSIAAKRKSFIALENLIGTLEKQRGNRVLTPKVQIEWDKVKGDFSKQKRKLNWPVTGKILHNFGRHKNPRLNTIIVNRGIDIKAVKGTDVHCVFSGVVSVITYMSGFGNTIIIDHNNGFYSVYAHLDEILVNKFQVLKAGSSLGTVGDSGSLEGALLHFEIYGANKPLNPISWLVKGHME